MAAVLSLINAAHSSSVLFKISNYAVLKTLHVPLTLNRQI